jgi:acetoin utilization protein AcuB
MMNETIANIMTTNVVSLSATDPLTKAYDLFTKDRKHHLPVLDGKKLVGILSSYDFLKKAIDTYKTQTVGDIMTTHIATLESTDKIGAATEVLMAHLFHAIPIVDNGEFVGIVTTFDILKYEYKKEYPNDESRLF